LSIFLLFLSNTSFLGIEVRTCKRAQEIDVESRRIVETVR